jgi:hypothetical protein
MTPDLVPIDAELLRKMRSEGRGREADALLRAYHQGCARQRAQDKREARTLQKRKLRAYGICPSCTIRETRPGRRLCEVCGKVRKQSGDA